MAAAILDDFFVEPIWPRTALYGVLGLVAWGERRPPEASDALRRLIELLTDLWDANATEEWPWFEDRLTYDNAGLPEALIRGDADLGWQEAVGAGLAGLGFYDSLCLTPAVHYRLPGKKWFDGSVPMSETGEEQPLEAAAMLDAHVAAYEITGSIEHLDGAHRAMAWFLGDNCAGLPVGHVDTGGCGDGLGDDQVSYNQGAESTLAFHRAALVHRRLVAGAARHPTLLTMAAGS